MALRWARERSRKHPPLFLAGLKGGATRLVLGGLVLGWLLAGPPLVGRAFAQGTRKDDIVLNARGTPQGGASVAVCTQPAVITSTPCSPLANLFSNPQLTQALVNPLATDGLGNYTFYAAPGKYTIQIYGPAITTKVIPDVVLPSDPSSPSFTNITATSGISAFSLTLTGNLTVNGSASVTLGISAATVTLSSQGTPPGAPAAGNVIVYTKTSDKKLYFKDETGQETGPLGPAGAGFGSNNIWTGDQFFKSGRPVYDVMAYGASASNQSTTGSITSGTATLTLAAAKDFVNGQGIAVYSAGPLSSLAAPTGVTATPALTTFYVQAGSVTRTGNVVTIKYKSPHFYAAGQSIILAGMSDATLNGTFTISTAPDAWTTTHAQTAANTTGGSGTVVLAAGGTTYTYRVAAVDSAGGLSPASAAASTTTGQATMSASGGNKITWNVVSGAVMYAIYGRTGTITALAMRRAQDSTGGVPETVMSFTDFGYSTSVPAYVPNAFPATATNKVLLTTISAGGGTTTLTLAANASATVAGASAQHDDTPAFQAAWNAAKVQAGKIYAPITTTGNAYNLWNLDLTTTTAWTVLQFDGQLLPHIPIVVKSFVALIGGMQAGAGTAAGNQKPYTQVTVSSTDSVAISPVISVQSAAIPAYVAHVGALSFYEGIRIGTGADFIELDNVNITNAGGGYGSPYRDETTAVNQGGFGHYVHDSAFAINGGTGAFPAMWFSGQGVVTSKGGYHRLLLTGGGIRIDRADFVAGGILGPYNFDEIGTETLPTSFLDVDSTGGTIEQITLNRIESSDSLMTTGSCINSLTAVGAISIVVINSRCGGGGGLLGGDNIRGVTVIGGVTDGGATDLNSGIGSGAGHKYIIQGHGGNFIVGPGNTSVFGAGAPLAGIATAFQQTDDNTIAAAVRGRSTSAVDLFQVQDSTGTPLVGLGRLASSDRLRVYGTGGALTSKFDNFGNLIVRSDGITSGLAGAGLASFGAFAGVPGIVIGPASGSQDSMQIFHTGSSTSKIFAVDSGDNTLIKRVKASQGTALGAGDFALSAGWGTTAAVSAVTGTDQGWNITVTANGTGIAANPTVTLTFKDGTWTNAPICVSKMVGGTGAVTQLTEAPAATTNTLTFQGTPVAASTYILASVCMGR